MRDFQHEAIEDLHAQLLLSPPEVRRRQADRLEELLLELEPERTYPYEFLYFRVTGFRPAEDARQTFRGDEVRRDLHVALECLSESAPTDAAEEEEPLYTIQDVAEMYSVSVRTVHRWRRRGLVARKYRFPDGRTRVGIRKNALDRFEDLYADRLERSRHFSRMSPEERARAIALVTELRREEDLSTTRAAARVAEELGRAPESVRRLVRRRGVDTGEAQPSERLGRAARRELLEEYRRGVPADQLADRYDRSRSSVYRIINQERARELLQMELSAFTEEDFEQEDVEEDIFDEAWEEAMGRARAGRAPDRTGPPLSAEQERALFRGYNYAKHRIRGGQEELNPRRYVSGRLLDRLEDFADRAASIHGAIERAYQPVVERVSRQHAGPEQPLAPLVAEGHERLEEAIENFDYRGRGRFRGYLKLEMQKALARLLSGEGAGE